MRKVKFRGWDKENKIWRYGWLTKLVEDTPRKFWAIIQDEDTGLVRYYIHEESSIGQCTGLTDVGGSEVYEGDIIKTAFGKHMWIYVIESLDRCPDGPLYAVEYLHNVTIDDNLDIYTYQFSDNRKGYRKEIALIGDVEVIGNIHHNPELVEISNYE